MECLMCKRVLKVLIYKINPFIPGRLYTGGCMKGEAVSLPLILIIKKAE